MSVRRTKADVARIYEYKEADLLAQLRVLKRERAEVKAMEAALEDETKYWRGNKLPTPVQQTADPDSSTPSQAKAKAT